MRIVKNVTAKPIIKHITHELLAVSASSSKLESYKSDTDKVSVFCLFDRDDPSSFQKAVSRINDIKMKKGHSLKAITSIPCFEFWLLIHFKCTTKPFSPSRNKSACETVIKELKKYMPSYKKGSINIFNEEPAGLKILPPQKFTFW